MDPIEIYTPSPLRVALWVPLPRPHQWQERPRAENQDPSPRARNQGLSFSLLIQALQEIDVTSVDLDVISSLPLRCPAPRKAWHG